MKLLKDGSVITNKEWNAYMEEVAKQMYVQGGIDMANGFLADDPADIRKTLEEVGKRVLDGGKQEGR